MHSALETLPPSAADAKELLEESKSELQLRQKHLRIADQHGWTAVQIYSQGRLGDSAEDEKLIAAAATAARKIQQPFRLAGRGRNTVMRGEPRSGFNTFFPRSNFNNADTGPYVRTQWAWDPAAISCHGNATHPSRLWPVLRHQTLLPLYML